MPVRAACAGPGLRLLISNGCRHTFAGTPGQKLYFRVAVQRRKSGQGLWSDVVAVTVT